MPHVNKKMLSFFLTTKCNLSCRYCYTNKDNYKHQTIPFEFAKLGIDTFLGKDKLKHIRFFGAGEPTEEFELMKKICDYSAKNLENDLTIETQTNGVFSHNKAEWLAEHFDIIWVSCDGLPDIQNYFRPTVGGGPSSKTLERNVNFLTKNCKGMTGIRTTITSLNIHKQIEIIKYFHELGVKYVWSDPIFPAVGSKTSINTFDVMSYAEEFVPASEFAASLGMVYKSFLTCNFDNETKYHCRACIPVPHLTTDGYISACDMALFGNEKDHMSIFIYGKWDKSKNTIVYDQNKINYLQSRSVDNMPGCKDCSVKYNCGGYCLGEVTNETNNLFGKKNSVCGPINYLAKKIGLNNGCCKYLHP